MTSAVDISKHPANGRGSLSAEPSICTYTAATPLEQIVQETRIRDEEFLLVVDDHGHLRGIVETSEVLARAECSNPTERARWLSKPVESLIALPLSTSEELTPESDETFLPLVQSGVTAAMVNRQSVLVNWRLIAAALHSASCDAVTGLLTRMQFERVLEQEVSRSQRRGRPVSVILFDLDRLKLINDEFGHATGDLALNLVASVITENLRSYDVTARYAGDEFAAVCYDCGPEDVVKPIYRIQKSLSERSLQDPTTGRAISLSLSIGATVLLSPAGHNVPRMLVQMADESLYAAKRGGRNRAYWTMLNGSTKRTVPKAI